MSEVSASSHSTASTLLQAQADTAVAQPAKQGPERYPQAPMLPAIAADCPVARRAQLSHLHSQLHLGCSMTGGRCQSVFPVVAAGCCSAAASIAAEGPGDRRGQSPMGPQLESSAAADDRCCACCHFQRISFSRDAHVSWLQSGAADAAASTTTQLDRHHGPVNRWALQHTCICQGIW